MSESHSRWGDLDVLEEGRYGGIWWCISRGLLSINGYVEIPEGLTINDGDVDVHGGITYRHGRIIGFDTAHVGDYWPEIMDVRVEEGIFPGRYRDMLRAAATRIWTHPEVIGEVKHLAGQVSWLYGQIPDGEVPHE